MHSRPHWRLSAPAWCALLAGLTITGILFVTARRIEHDRMLIAFERQANIQFAGIASGINHALGSIQTLNRLLSTMRPASGDQFNAVARPLVEQHTYLQLISVHCMVPARERGTYDAAVRSPYPGIRITQIVDRSRRSAARPVDPFQDAQGVGGVDMLPHLCDALAAESSPRGSTVPFPDLVQLADAKRGLIVAMPVYRQERVAATGTNHQALHGMTVAMFRVQDLMQDILRSGKFIDAPHLTMSVYMGDTRDEQHLLFRTGSNADHADMPSSPIPSWLFWDHTDTAVQVMNVAGKAWFVDLSSDPTFFLASHGMDVPVLLGGILLTLLATASLQRLALRTQHIRQLVDERTAELARANDMLSHDMAARKQTEAALAFHANHDSLTGLANGNLLRDRLVQMLAYAERYGHRVWVCCFNLGHFKIINDTLSHKAGDVFLKAIAERLTGCVRETDTTARLGSDEFVLLLLEHAGDPIGPLLVKRVQEAIAQPIVIEGHEFFPSCSMGVAQFPDHGTDPDTLLRNAGIAMHWVKEAGGNNWQTYAASMSERSLERLAIENDLRHALERDELLLHFQPQVDLRSGRITGMEALLRWQHPRLGIVSPTRFIGLAEESGLIVPIGTWALRTACRMNRMWQDAGLSGMRVAVNMSPRQFYLDDAVARVQEVLTETGLEPGCLEIELTESLLMTNIEQAVDTLGKLKAMGVRLAIDDFGTGYSSLSYLKRFPIDVLKIDQSFVRDVTSNSQDATIVQSIISLAHSLRLTVLAEGVETEPQLAYLQRHGCDDMQGFYFSRPLSAEAMTELLLEGRRLPVRLADLRTKRQTLLIVDDDAAVIASLRRLLRHEGYTILSAASAAEALELLALHDVQVVLSDHRMPGMTGAEFFAQVKIMYPDTMRVMLTGYTELASVIDAINRGEIFRFITKPWENDVLINSLREIFHHYRVLRAERLRMESVTEGPNAGENSPAYLHA